MRRIARAVASGLALALACAAPASATCAFQSITSMQFTYGGLGAGAATAAATMSVSCDASSASNVSIALDAGLHAGASPNPSRHLLNAANDQTLDYNVFTDGAYTTIWGDGTNGTAVQSHAQAPGSFSLTLYGLIPSGQHVPAGTYADVLTATMIF